MQVVEWPWQVASNDHGRQVEAQAVDILGRWSRVAVVVPSFSWISSARAPTMAAVPDPPCTIPTHLLGLTTTHILRSSRFAACSTTAHAALTTVLERYLAVLAGACVRAAGEAGRARPSAWDVMRVVQEFGGELEELELWARGNADEEGRTGRIGVVGGMEVLRGGCGMKGLGGASRC